MEGVRKNCLDQVVINHLLKYQSVCKNCLLKWLAIKFSLYIWVLQNHTNQSRVMWWYKNLCLQMARRPARRQSRKEIFLPRKEWTLCYCLIFSDQLAINFCFSYQRNKITKFKGIFTWENVKYCAAEWPEVLQGMVNGTNTSNLSTMGSILY